MKASFKYLFAFAIIGVCSLGKAWAAPICPTTASTNSDCSYILTIGAGGTVTGSPVAGANPYDGSDDSLVGVVNNSGSTYMGSISLSGSGNGGGLFAFDGDGICAYTQASYCSTAPTGYEGPGVTFSGITAGGTSGMVDFSGIAAGGTAFFSLESSPASINGGGGPVINQTPEPSSIFLLGTGALSVAAGLRRKLMSKLTS